MNPEERPTDEVTEFELPFGWGFRIFEAAFFAGLLAFSITSLVMAVVGVISGDAGLIRSLVSALGGSAGVLVSIAGGKNALQLLFDRRPALRVSEEGVLNRTYWSETALVPWDEVIDIRKSRYSFISEIVLADPKAFRSRQGLWIRIMMRITSLLGIGSLPVYLPQMTESGKEVTTRLKEALASRELAVVREQRRLEAAVATELLEGDSE